MSKAVNASELFPVFYEVASGGRVKRKKRRGERNEINIIEILYVIFDSNCFYGSDKKRTRETSQSDEFAFLPFYVLHLWKPHDVQNVLFFCLWAEWVSDFLAINVMITKLLFFHSSCERRDQNEWCSSKSWGLNWSCF